VRVVVVERLEVEREGGRGGGTDEVEWWWRGLRWRGREGEVVERMRWR
jgi:hypothetical protein